MQVHTPARTQTHTHALALTWEWAATQERAYNPYYGHVATRLCAGKYAVRITFQYAYWDAFKALEETALRARVHLARLLAHLLRTEAVHVAVFKVRRSVSLCYTFLIHALCVPASACASLSLSLSPSLSLSYILGMDAEPRS
jgi:hypothetical protein